LARSLQAQGIEARWIDPLRYHMTVLYLGQSEGPRKEVMDRARQTAANVSAAGFDAAMDRLSPFGNSREPALALNCSALPALASAFAAALRDATLPPAYGYRPIPRPSTRMSPWLMRAAARYRFGKRRRSCCR